MKQPADQGGDHEPEQGLAFEQIGGEAGAEDVDQAADDEKAAQEAAEPGRARQDQRRDQHDRGGGDDEEGAGLAGDAAVAVEVVGDRDGQSGQGGERHKPGAGGGEASAACAHAVPMLGAQGTAPGQPGLTSRKQ